MWTKLLVSSLIFLGCCLLLRTILLRLIPDIRRMRSRKKDRLPGEDSHE